MSKSKTYELILMGMLTGILFMGQVFLAFLPNVEIVSLLILLYTLTFGRKVFIMIYTFVLLEGIFYGFGLWWINYLYIWSILAVVVLLFKKQRSPLFWSIVNGFFGLCFGALCALPYLFIGGPAAAFSYWITGIPYDIPHCIGNAVLCLLLFKPGYYILNWLYLHAHTAPMNGQ